MTSNIEYKTPLGTLYNSNCLEIMSKLSSDSIDMVFADPPYNVGKDYGETYDDSLPESEYFNWVENWIKEGFRLLKDTGSFYFLINSKTAFKVAPILDKYGRQINAIIWIKKAAPIQGERNLAKNYRILLFYVKTSNYKFYPDIIRVPHRFEPYRKYTPEIRNPEGRRLDDTWEDITELVSGYLIQPEVVRHSGSKQPVLPQQCPEEIVRRAISLSTDKSDIVLDPFMGMGTTAVVAEKNNRKWIGMEINPKFCKLIEKRLELVWRQQKLFV